MSRLASFTVIGWQVTHQAERRPSTLLSVAERLWS